MSDGTIARQLGTLPPRLAAALSARTEIFGLSEASHAAVLTPAAPGGLSHTERAALAARMARRNGDDALARHYEALLARSGAAPDVAAIAYPAVRPKSPRLAAIVRHIDLLTTEPRSASRADIEALKAAGIAEPDIVRLSELAAFVNYQARVIAGLRLLKATA
jgi:uncharacterized protein YciW